MEELFFLALQLDIMSNTWEILPCIFITWHPRSGPGKEESQDSELCLSSLIIFSAFFPTRKGFVGNMGLKQPLLDIPFLRILLKSTLYASTCSWITSVSMDFLLLFVDTGEENLHTSGLEFSKQKLTTIW